MSAIGTKRTWVGALQMSAYDPKRACQTDSGDTGLRLLSTCEASATKHRIIHQIDKADVAFIKGIMTGRGTCRLRLLAELSVHSEPLLENDAPINGQILD